MIQTMPGNLQPLDQKFPIVTPDGRPTLYFIKWAQQKQIDIGQGITAEQALNIIQQYLADHQIQAGSGIAVTPSGNLSDMPTIAAEVQAILDQITTTQGSILFRGAADWQALAPGTAGQVLKSNGAGADPAWAAGGGGGGGGAHAPFVVPDLTDFPNWVNQGSATATQRSYSAVISSPNAANNMTIRTKAIPSSPYIITAALRFAGRAQGAPKFGICLRNSGSGALITFGVQINTSTSNAFQPMIFTNTVQKYTSPTVFNSDYTNQPGIPFAEFWVRVEDNGVNRITSISPNGDDWIVIHTVGRTDYIIPDEVGFFIVIGSPAYTSIVELLSYEET